MSSKCLNFCAGHGFDPINNGNSDPASSPVKLVLGPEVQGSSLAPGQIVSVSLEVADPEKSSFRGFIIQARDEEETQVGSFTIDGDNVSHMTCGKGNPNLNFPPC